MIQVSYVIAVPDRRLPRRRARPLPPRSEEPRRTGGSRVASEWHVKGTLLTMTNRRAFLQSATALAAAQANAQTTPQSDRAYWLRILEKLAEPVLGNLAAGALRKNMPVESVGDIADR